MGQLFLLKDGADSFEDMGTDFLSYRKSSMSGTTATWASVNTFVEGILNQTKQRNKGGQR